MSSGVRKSIQKINETANASMARDHPLRQSHDSPAEPKPNESFSNEAATLKSYPAAQSTELPAKQIYAQSLNLVKRKPQQQYSEEKKGTEYSEEMVRVPDVTAMIFAQLKSEMLEIKKSMAALHKTVANTAMANKKQAEKPVIKEVSKKEKEAVSSSKGALPSYILTLTSMNVSKITKKKVPASDKEQNIVKIQALIRGALVRKRLTKYRFQQYCIKKIQAYIRGFLARKKHKDEVVKEKEKEKAKTPAKAECEKCKKYEEEISELKEQIKELKTAVDECTKAKEQHEKALKYLFTQMKTLVGHVDPANEGKKEKIVQEQKKGDANSGEIIGSSSIDKKRGEGAI